MGFFSSRKAEDNNEYVTTVLGGNDKSVVKVIRSRFYGKSKGKEREGPASFKSQGASVAETLASPIPTPRHTVATSTPTHSPSKHTAGPSILRHHNSNASAPTTPSKRKFTSTYPPSTPPSTRTRENSSVHVKTPSGTPSSSRHADNVSMTLAQRLNDLALANSDGLLNDDEYRLLRQNLFERFSGSATVPTETPVVPIARPRPRPTAPSSDSKAISRPLSNFQVEAPRPSSIVSKSSMTSGVTNIFRRATGRHTDSGSRDYSDTSSIWSSTSTTSNIFKRILSKKSSNSSIRTTASRTQPDTVSVTSNSRGVEPVTQFSPTRSTPSIRKLATPPSSFPTRLGQDNKHAMNINSIFDEENLKTSKQIQDEIMSVEAEARRLMDAFNGLEMTTLTKLHRSQNRSTAKKSEGGKHIDSTWDTKSHRRINANDADALSVHSATSIGTTPSLARSAYSSRKVNRQKTNLSVSNVATSTSRPGSLHRNNSSSSLASDKRVARPNVPPPVPAIPSVYGGLTVASRSNISLTRSHLTNVIHEDEATSLSDTVRVEEEDFNHEMDDIRRRREEVSQRYDARLEYLRAKLKGAQLHEKLLKK